MAGGPGTFDLRGRWPVPTASSPHRHVRRLSPLRAECTARTLIFKTGGVDASHNDTLMKLIEGGKICRPLIAYHALNNIMHGARF